jgi:hypothetical protein
MRAATEHPPDHHPQAEGNRGQPGEKGNQPERGPADLGSRRSEDLRLAALRGNADDQVLQILARLSDAFALAHLSVRANSSRVKRAADSEVDLGC